MIRRLTNHHLPRASARAGLALVLLISAIVGVRAADTTGNLANDPGSWATAAAADTTQLNGGGAKNVVNILNRQDARLTVRGKIEFNGIPAPRVAPVNLAAATASCVGCQTYAVALQVDVYERGAPFVAPQNAATAVNAACTRCVTVARAIQYVIPVDDIHDVPKNVRKLTHDLNARLQAIEGVYDTAQFNAFQADAQILAVIASFQELADDLLNDVKVETATDTPQASASAAPEGSPSPTDAPQASASDSPDVSPTATAAPATSEPSPSDTPVATNEPTATPVPSEAPAESSAPESAAAATPTPDPTTDPPPASDAPAP
ncbi:MAG: hypothetical protein ACJ761_00305 [Chloroflexota bacterium]